MVTPLPANTKQKNDENKSGVPKKMADSWG
jgi:hypothetical protein